MGWDSTRPVPWQRLIREWLIYVAVMAVVFFVLFRDSGIVGALAGLLVSGPLYLLFGFAMAKFGYQRKSLKDMRTPRAAARTSSDGGESAGSRLPPPPTKRTSGGGNRPPSRRRRR